MNRAELKELLPLMQAWADGKTLQVRNFVDWQTIEHPTWSQSASNYRIKPETGKYRVALCRGVKFAEIYPAITRSPDMAARWEETGLVDRWLTDWIEYEV
jgi:hypothetical protein